GGLDAPSNRRADGIDDQIDAAPAAQTPRLRDPIVVAVVYPVVQPEFLQPLQLLVAGRRGQDGRARPLGHLDSGQADAAGARLDEHVPALNADRLDVDQHATRLADGLGHLFVAEDVRGSGLVINCCFHWAGPFTLDETRARLRN